MCRLPKSIYDLKQTSRQWFSKFTNALIRYGFHQSKCYYSQLTKRSGNSLVALLVYVDDIVITGCDHQAIESLKTFLHTQFKLKDLGQLKYFLGLEITRSHKSIFLSQHHHAFQLLEDAGFLACKPGALPIDPKVCLSLFEGELLADASLYRRLVDHLLYLTISKPDITFAVHKLSQFVSQPRQPHIDVVNHLLRYIKSTSG